ncbi:MobA/MobL family protein [Sphingomonas sp. LY54]|uniref:MobA/MobL family protein n=1 Tax=Sphingomonas sp. LY54 TaxID=3095343 RepID=UPI002D776C11|nr:MobA/MobL family protein [Sphingomonas sp. LY54]WRP30020.1 MobA/MobL family protein [Sphingomonas sp. LY54]
MIHPVIRLPFVCEPVALHQFGRPDCPDERRTALREATYIRRTQFTKEGRTLHDFTMRGEDLFTLIPILPDDAPDWVNRPYLRWQLADEAAELTDRPNEVRAWHVCGDLKPSLTRGEWVDQVEAMTRAALPKGTVAEIAIHVPRDKPPHAHVLVAARYPARRCYGRLCPVLGTQLGDRLGGAWLKWLEAAEARVAQ